MSAGAAMRLAIALTGEILDLLEAGDYAHVNRLELRRQAAIRQAFSAPVASIDPIGAQQLRNLNQQVVDKLELARQAIVLQQARLRTAGKANRAYLETVSTGR